MITSEESQEVGEFLNGKNLPLDLKVEILDHISEQINYKMEIEKKDFPLALAEIKESWKEDLAMKKTFFAKESRTKIQRQTIRKAGFEIFKKAGIYSIFYFVISLFLICYNKNLAYNFTFIFYLILTVIFILLVILNFKVLNLSSKQKYNNISYLQSGLTLYTTANIFIPSMILFNFSERFDKYYNSVLNLVYHAQFNPVSFGAISIFNMYAFGWFYGFLYFLEYKKTLKILEQKINFKL